MNGRAMEIRMAMRIIHTLVWPNWEMPKNVATVLGKDVTVVTIVR
jgi:hypothetical protein